MGKDISKVLKTQEEVLDRVKALLQEAIDWEVFDVNNQGEGAQYGSIHLEIRGVDKNEGYEFRVINDDF